jgi:hypothetical protein
MGFRKKEIMRSIKIAPSRTRTGSNAGTLVDKVET